MHRQLGPGVVMIPATIWLFVEGDTVGGVFLTVVFIVIIG